MNIALETKLPCSYEEAVKHAKQPQLLMYIAKPLVFFKPCDGTVTPEVWAEQTYWFQLKLFGFLPMGKQAVCISFPPDTTCFRLQDDGYSRLIRQWHHKISIRPGNGDVIYRDEVNISAGVLTPFVWLFARIFFAHRQRRWVQLANSQFAYEDSRTS